MIPALYIHIPFCVQRCSYCHFFTIKTNPQKEGPQIFEHFIKLLKKELSLYARDYPKNTFKSVFIGGGTPSLLEERQIYSLFKKLHELFILKNAEISIEVHPESVSREKLKVYQSLGINRISMGCETFNDSILKNINRLGSAKNIISKYHLIRELGFKNINLDLIFGLWNQKEKDYLYDLNQIIELNPEHISSYGLMLKEDPRSEKKKLPEDEFYEKAYFMTIEKLKEKNYSHYEISNFAKKNKKCLHNQFYWNQKNYIGIGPSAVGTIDSLRYKNVYNFQLYEKKLLQNEKPFLKKEYLTEEIKNKEKIILGLRQKKGLFLHEIDWDKSSFKKKDFVEKLLKYQKYGFMNLKEDHFSMTYSGFLVYDQIVSELI